MAIFTPSGLKIRLDPVFAFTLLSRLEPAVAPIEVLRTTEAVEMAPSLAGQIAVVIAISLRMPPLTVFWVSLGARVFVGTLTLYGAFVVPGLIPLSRGFSRLSGWGVFLVAVVIYSWITLGWPAAVAYVSGVVVAGLVNMAVEWHRSRYYMKRIGVWLTGAEVNFISAYRLHAQAIGKTTDVDTKDDERVAGWAALLRFANEYPEIAARFS